MREVTSPVGNNPRFIRHPPGPFQVSLSKGLDSRAEFPLQTGLQPVRALFPPGAFKTINPAFHTIKQRPENLHAGMTAEIESSNHGDIIVFPVQPLMLANARLRPRSARQITEQCAKPQSHHGIIPRLIRGNPFVFTPGIKNDLCAHPHILPHIPGKWRRCHIGIDEFNTQFIFVYAGPS